MMLRRTLLGLAVAAGMLIVAVDAPAEDSTNASPSNDSKSWIFDQGLYTNSTKTGERVWQYSAPKPAYRDPNALYDSPHGSYPFLPDVYDPYWRYDYLVPYGMPAYYPYPPPAYGPVPMILPSSPWGTN